MKLPFGLPSINEITVKSKDELAGVVALYGNKLAEYKEALDGYKRFLDDNMDKLDRYDEQKVDNQITESLNTIELSYLREKCDKAIRMLEEWNTSPVSRTPETLESMTTTLADISYKLDGLDKNTVNRLSELMLELQKQLLFQNKQLHTELMEGVDKLSNTIKKGQALYWINLIINILGLSGLIFLILYILEVIPF